MRPEISKQMQSDKYVDQKPKRLEHRSNTILLHSAEQLYVDSGLTYSTEFCSSASSPCIQFSATGDEYTAGSWLHQRHDSQYGK